MTWIVLCVGHRAFPATLVPMEYSRPGAAASEGDLAYATMVMPRVCLARFSPGDDHPELTPPTARRGMAGRGNPKIR